MFDEKEYFRQYYLKNKEKKLAQASEWGKANQQRRREISKKYKKNHPEKVKEENEKYLLRLNLANVNISARTLNAWGKQVKKETKSCCYCGSRDRLQAHHILSKSKHPEFALFLNNGIALCEKCHIQEHKLNGEI